MDPIKWYYQRRMLNAMVQSKGRSRAIHPQAFINHEGPSMGLHYNLALIALGLGTKKGL